MQMNKPTLLDTLAPQNHDKRVITMIALGERAYDEPEVAALIAALEAGSSSYERMLALYSCYSSHDGAQVLRALGDQSHMIRHMALRLVAYACDDEQALLALANVPVRDQRFLLSRLRRAKRFGPIERFLATASDAALPQVFMFGRAEHVQALLARAAETMAAYDWRRLAKCHPQLTAEALTARAQATTKLDQRLIWMVNLAMPVLGRQVPNAALLLVRTLLPHAALAQLDLLTLVQQRPQQVADLVLEHGEPIRLQLDRFAHRFDTPLLLALLARGRLVQPSTWLRRLPPTARVEAYTAAGLGWRDADGRLPLHVVSALPQAQRESEARRNMQLAVLATRPAERLPYAACLPWDEARAALDPFIRHPDPELRAVALPALIGVGRYDPNRLDDIVAFIHGRRNEQDPVRLAMLAALANLPPARWRETQLDALGQLVRDALDARDISYTTAAQAERLVLRLLPRFATWSASWLATLGRERGIVFASAIGRLLTENEVRQIAPALLPVLRAWEPREREQAIFRVAALINRRLPVFPELLAMIERLTHDQRAWVAAQALEIVAAHARTRIPELVPALLAEDKSWVTRQTVWEYLHRRRQDLLTPLLGQTAYAGRFSTGRTRFVLPIVAGFFRWTPAQQEIFARVLEQVTRDEERDTPALFFVITQLAALTTVAPTRLIELAAFGGDRLAARDKAIVALGRLDGGRGVAPLLDMLGDDRARIAIYALRRAVLEMPPGQALMLLKNVPLTKVTVAKEVVRLIGELPTEQAYAELLAIDSQELHRDVRVALLRALWDHAEHDATWPILMRAATAADPAIADGVIRIPADRRSPAALRQIARLLAHLLAHPEPKVVLDTLNRCATLPIADDERVLAAPLLATVGSPVPDLSVAAARAVVATYTGREATQVATTVRAILPQRRALASFLAALHGALGWSGGRLLPTVQAVLGVLNGDALLAEQQLRLAIAAQPAADVAALAEQLAGSDRLHPEALMAGVAAIIGRNRSVDADFYTALERTLAPAVDARLRRLALAALVGQAQVYGWTAERRSHLLAYRADSAPFVAAAAQFVFPPEETEK